MENTLRVDITDVVNAHHAHEIMDPFSTDEKSDEPRPVFHLVENDRADRTRRRNDWPMRTKPGKTRRLSSIVKERCIR